MHKKCSLLIYKTILKPVLKYGYTLGDTASKTIIKQTQIIQNKILRIILKAPWYIRNKQIHEELGIMSMEYFIRNTTSSLCEPHHHIQGQLTISLAKKTVNNRLQKRLP